MNSSYRYLLLNNILFPGNVYALGCYGNGMKSNLEK